MPRCCATALDVGAGGVASLSDADASFCRNWCRERAADFVPTCTRHVYVGGATNEKRSIARLLENLQLVMWSKVCNSVPSTAHSAESGARSLTIAACVFQSSFATSLRPSDPSSIASLASRGTTTAHAVTPPPAPPSSASSGAATIAATGDGDDDDDDGMGAALASVLAAAAADRAASGPAAGTRDGDGAGAGAAGIGGINVATDMDEPAGLPPNPIVARGTASSGAAGTTEDTPGAPPPPPAPSAASGASGDQDNMLQLDAMMALLAQVQAARMAWHLQECMMYSHD